MYIEEEEKSVRCGERAKECSLTWGVHLFGGSFGAYAKCIHDAF